ncbi:hypothetical protein P7C73_g4722, partial [Tremellales sp. Uapishka_1]
MSGSLSLSAPSPCALPPGIPGSSTRHTPRRDLAPSPLSHIRPPPPRDLQRPHPHLNQYQHHASHSSHAHSRTRSETAHHPATPTEAGFQAHADAQYRAMLQSGYHRPCSPLMTGSLQAQQSFSLYHTHSLSHPGPGFLHHPEPGPSAFRSTPRPPSPERSTHTRGVTLPRGRVISRGHGKHLKCSPDCTAAEPPYRFLKSIIGRASRLGTRNILHTAFASFETPQTQSSLQKRRVHRQTPVTPPINNSHDWKPLMYDRKLWEMTPPLPPTRKVSPDSDFFSFYGPLTSPAVLQYTSPDLEVEIARPSSAPTIPASPARERSVSEGPPANVEFSRHQPSHSLDIGLRDPHLREGPISRFAPHYSKRADTDRRPIHDALQLAPYLGPELLAALQQREATEQKKKMESLSDAEWSFDIPLSAVMSDVIKVHKEVVGTDFKVAEYGCGTDSPNTVLADIVRHLCKISSLESVAVVHQCSSVFDIRPLQSALNSHPDSYRKTEAAHAPVIFSSFSFSGFAQPAFTRSSVDLGIGGNDLSRIHSWPSSRSVLTSTSREIRERLADKDLSSWLSTRAQEIRPGGTLAFHFAIRSTAVPDQAQPPRASPLAVSISLPSSPRESLDGTMPAQSEYAPHPISTRREYRPDIWQLMAQALSPAIQRLVTLGDIRPYTAPALVDVPFWPRTLSGAKKTLGKLQDWELVRLDLADGDGGSETVPFTFTERMEWLDVGVHIHRLTHPAWAELKEGKIDKSEYARRVATFVRSVYETHLKKVLRGKGGMDVGHSESTVQELFKILVEKCELGVLDALELDIGVVVLRRL